MRSGAVISLTKERSKECVDEKIKVKMGERKVRTRVKRKGVRVETQVPNV